MRSISSIVYIFWTTVLFEYYIVFLLFSGFTDPITPTINHSSIFTCSQLKLLKVSGTDPLTLKSILIDNLLLLKIRFRTVLD